jgi:STE24 endopeptidase
VLWDTILKAARRRQLLVVMGHEMGHYVLDHIWKLIGVLAVTICLLFYAVHRLASTLITASAGGSALRRSPTSRRCR